MKGAGDPLISAGPELEWLIIHWSPDDECQWLVGWHHYLPDNDVFLRRPKKSR